MIKFAVNTYGLSAHGLITMNTNMNSNLTQIRKSNFPRSY